MLSNFSAKDTCLEMEKVSSVYFVGEIPQQFYTRFEKPEEKFHVRAEQGEDEVLNHIDLLNYAAEIEKTMNYFSL